MSSCRAARVTGLALAVVAAATLAALSPATAESASRVIRADRVLGGYQMQTAKDGTLGGAIATFGAPASLRRKFGNICILKYPSLGMTLTFANLGGANPCTPQNGFFTRAVVKGKGWRTVRGLKIGNRAARVQRLHPAATFAGRKPPNGKWWLIARRSIVGTDPDELTPKLLTRVKNGRVVSFEVRASGAGE